MQHYKNMVKLFESFRYKHQIHEVFGDFLYLTASAFSNSVDKVHYEKRESEYLRRIKKYEKQEYDKFPLLISELVMCFEVGGFNDHLGKLFMDLGLGNSFKGQYFTPYSVSKAMASMVFDEENVKKHIDEKGYMTLYEPTCGAGGMIIAASDVVYSMGLNPQQILRVTSQDVDLMAVLMTYIQTTLLGLDNTVILGNTLTLEQRDVWRTPGRYLRILASMETSLNKAKEITSEKLDIYDGILELEDSGQFVLAI